MAEFTNLMECIDAVLWLILVLICFKDLKKWNRAFTELYNALEGMKDG